MISRQDRTSTLIAFSFAALGMCSLPVFGTRFLNDMEFYSLFADKLLSGGVLYRDALDTKPPLVFLHYALVFKLFGQNNMMAVKFVTMGWLGVSTLVMVALRSVLSPAAAVPALAAPVFILASFSGWGEEFLSSNTELLANLFILAGVWLLVSQDFGRRPLRLVVGGAFVGIACLYRYQSGAALLAYAATLLLRGSKSSRTIARLLLVGAASALPGAILVAYYARMGALADLQLMKALQMHYANDPDAFRWCSVLGRILITLSGLWPVLLLAAWQAVAILRKGKAASQSEIFQLMFVACSAATFFVGGRFFPHYFVQSIPAVVLLATERLGDSLAPRTSRQAWFEARAGTILILVAAVFTATNGIYYWSRNDEPPSRKMVAFIEANSRPSDQVLMWAWRPHLLIEAKRVFATRLLVNSPLIGQLDPIPVGRSRVRRRGLTGLWPIFLRDLSSAPPRLIIDELPGRWPWSLDRYPQVAWLLGDYHACQIIDGLCVYLRKE
jgi:hypothetical protein